MFAPYLVNVDGMQYHLMGKGKSDHTYTDRIRPRVQKHDYQIAMFGGSEAQTCQLFNPKGKKKQVVGVLHAMKEVYILASDIIFQCKFDKLSVELGKSTALIVLLRVLQIIPGIP